MKNHITNVEAVAGKHLLKNQRKNNMKLNYLVLSSEPILKVKFFYEDGDRRGEFYMEFKREARDANNVSDKLGVRGSAEMVKKDKEYVYDLVQGFAQTMKG